MRSPKPDTNTTVSTRVDDDDGRHRQRRALSEPHTCAGCGVGYLRRRWVPLTDDRAAVLAASPLTTHTLCPACHALASSTVGSLHVEGLFFREHQEDIEHLIDREAERAREEDPLGRVLSRLQVTPDALIVSTTTEQLAQRIGHALHKAYAGTVTYRFSHENTLTRVTWHRD
jgi:hypothetical protein